MNAVSADVLALVFARLRQVQSELGMTPLPPDDPEALLADQIDSMGLVELLAVLAEEYGVRTEEIERAAGNRFSTVASLAAAVDRATSHSARTSPASDVRRPDGPVPASCWLSAVKGYLPRAIEDACELDRRLERSAGWVEAHAGIKRRHVWADEDPLMAAAELGKAALQEAGLLSEEVGVLLVTSQAPPRLAGLAAAVHHRLGLPPRTVALEVGGACTGFLQALWLARNLIAQAETALVMSVEAPSRHLTVEPGEAGEAAALFGDGTACCVVTRSRIGEASLPLVDVELSVAGDEELLRVEGSGRGGVCVRMDGPRLASRAVEGLADMIRQIAQRHECPLADLAGAAIHAGNGRMPALVARCLGLAEDRVWSSTAETGNLGSASLPMAWARAGSIRGTVAWAALGAGLTFASALTRPPAAPDSTCPA